MSKLLGHQMPKYDFRFWDSKCPKKIILSGCRSYQQCWKHRHKLRLCVVNSILLENECKIETSDCTIGKLRFSRFFRHLDQLSRPTFRFSKMWLKKFSKSQKSYLFNHVGSMILLGDKLFLKRSNFDSNIIFRTFWACFQTNSHNMHCNSEKRGFEKNIYSLFG